MTAYLVGALGFLSGAVLALWWRYKLARSGSIVVGLTNDVTSLTLDKARLDEKLVAATVEHADALARRDAELQVHTAREESLRDLLRQTTDPAVVTKRVGLLFRKKP